MFGGADWIGVKRGAAGALKGVEATPLGIGLSALLALLGAILFVWTGRGEGEGASYSIRRGRYGGAPSSANVVPSKFSQIGLKFADDKALGTGGGSRASIASASAGRYRPCDFASCGSGEPRVILSADERAAINRSKAAAARGEVREVKSTQKRCARWFGPPEARVVRLRYSASDESAMTRNLEFLVRNMFGETTRSP